METRNVAITLEKAKEWYKGCNSSLKEVALQAFTKEELEEFNFRNIKTFEDAIDALGLDRGNVFCALQDIIDCGSLSSAAFFKLNIIRKALNKGIKMNFTEGTIWCPVTPAILDIMTCPRKKGEIVTAKIKMGRVIFNLIGGRAISNNEGLGFFHSGYGIATTNSSNGFLGCATKEIAEHMGIFFSQEIFDAKYRDFVDYEWV